MNGTSDTSRFSEVVVSGSRTGGVIYLFTICEYGGGEIAWCTLTCEEGFADGFELGVRMRINEEVHYIVREEIGEEDLAGHTASHRALDTSSLKHSRTLVADPGLRT